MPYVYVHSKGELGAAGQTKRPTSAHAGAPRGGQGGDKMSSDDAKEFAEMYGKVEAKIKSIS